MAAIANVNLNRAVPFRDFLELGRDYCSDQLGHFFQNKYSLTAEVTDEFEIPSNLVGKKERNAMAICVMMNNHIVDLKYFSDIFPEWNEGMAQALSGQNPAKFKQLMSDTRLRSVIHGFKKLNDEIVIGRCNNAVFTTL